MPKRTIKYTSALQIVEVAWLNPPVKPSQEELYSFLNSQNYFWDSKSQQWQFAEPAQEATQLVRLRVWASSDKVSEIAKGVKAGMKVSGYELLEESKPYVCRPPQQNDSRIYLTFRKYFT